MNNCKNSVSNWFCVTVLLLILVPNFVSAGIPDVSHVMPTDVTPVSFSVIWVSGEPGTADTDVFEDQNGNIPVTGAITIPHPTDSDDEAIKTSSENNGVMKVLVTGLEPGKTYYFRTITTSKSTSETTVTALEPVTTAQNIVRTMQRSGDVVPFSNDVIYEPCYLDDGTTPAEGTLLVATAAGAQYPLTAFVGDGVSLPYALIDMNNFFDRQSGENSDLARGANLTLLNFRGMAGNSIVVHKVPEDNLMSEVKSPDPGLKTGANFVSFQLEPSDPDVLSVLSPILSQTTSVWAYDKDQSKWVFYDKNGLPFLNELGELHASEGYWLEVEQDTSWIVRGEIPSDEPVSLKAGENLVGYRSIETLPIMDALASIYDKLISIWTFSEDEQKWIFYDKQGLAFLNELEVIQPGKAYWVIVQEDCVWQ